MQDILHEINRDHNDEWQDYDETDWKEGWDVWVKDDGYLTLMGDS